VVGALRSITDDKPHQHMAMIAGTLLGLAIQVARKLIFGSGAWQRFVASGRRGRVGDWLLDAVFLPSPYASSFGTFFNWPTSAWLAAGSVVADLSKRFTGKRKEDAELPSDMSTVSLVGGGFIAGDALAALTLGLIGLAAAMAG
jgi:hypothetical protein